MTQNTNVEALIATLQRLGLELQNPAAIREDDKDPYSILTAMDKNYCRAFSHVLEYDAEMVDCDNSYTDWVHEWASATGKEDRVTDVAGKVNFVDEGPEPSWLTYSIDGNPVRLEFPQEDDWLNIDVYDRILEDFGTVPGRTRLYIGSGQTGVYIWVLNDGVAEFTALFPEAEVV